MTDQKIKSVFLSSIYQNAGKTTMALGLCKIFKERRLKTTFMKPVGQQFLTVNRIHVDKDSYLISEVYHFHRMSKEMSPITVGKGFTEKYILNPQKEVLRKAIMDSYQKLSAGMDTIIIEGTGHAGVGSVIDLSNADVAQMLRAKVIIISEGGIGKSIDEIMLNKALFDNKNVEVLGVIVNKVIPEKFKKIKTIVGQGLKNKGLRLLGVIPSNPILSAPTMEEIMGRLNYKLLCGRKNLRRHVRNTIVAAMEPHNMIGYIRDETLVLTSGDRVDNIMVAVSAHLMRQGRRCQVSGMILTGNLMPNPQIIDLLKKSKVPVLIAPEDTYTVAAKIEHLICKIQKTDKDKILEARQLVRQYVNVDMILKNL